MRPNVRHTPPLASPPIPPERTHPNRIRWLLSLPWEYPASALKELDRAYDNGAVGIMVLANIAGRHLVEAAFAPIWKAIDDEEKMGAVLT